MKKILFLIVFVVSFTALHSTDYKYFTAKQGLPKALEVANQLSKDSIQLYSIYCSGFYIDSVSQVYRPIETISIDNIHGTAQQWYYEFATLGTDSVFKIKIKNDSIDFLVDSLTITYHHFYSFEKPINIDVINIDSDSLLSCFSKCNKSFFDISMMHLQNKENNPFNDSYPIWVSPDCDLPSGDLSSFTYFVNAYTGECYELILDVKDSSSQNKQLFDIKISQNSDLISINSNNQLIQNASLRVFNQMGCMVYENKFNTQNYQFNTALLSSGLYFLQIIYFDKVETKPFIIVH